MDFSFFQLNVLHTELAKQLADTMVLPIVQFREKDLTGKVTEFSGSYLQNINSSNNNLYAFISLNVWITEKCPFF